LKNIKISSLQLGIIVFFLCQALFFPLASHPLYKNVEQEIWICSIIGTGIGFVIIKLFLLLQAKLQDKNILEYNIYKFGKLLGNIINFITVFMIIITMVSLFSKFCIFINVNYLPNMPLLIIQITFILVIIYAIKKGIESIFRSAQIFSIISIILLISAFTLNAYNFNINNIFPILEHKVSNILLSSLYYALISTLPIFLLSIFPNNIVLKKEQYNKSIILGYLFSSIVTIIIFITTLLVLGKHLIVSFEYPEFIAFKQIQYFYFIERLEIIFSSIWIFNVFVFCIISLYFVYKYLKFTFNVKNTNFILILLSIIIILLSNLIIFNNFWYYLFIKYIIFVD